MKSDIVCSVFDIQNRGASMKDITRRNRDEEVKKECPEVEVNDEMLLPSDFTWMEFLANRIDKKNLVNYVVEKLKSSQEKLKENQILIISAEETAWKVTSSYCLVRPSLESNQEEADTKMFFIANTLNLNSCLICSTDSDVLFVACLLAPHLIAKNIYIQYNVASSPPEYVDLCKLFDLMDADADPLIALAYNQGKNIPQVFGILHFISGCDYLCHLKGFSKLDCCKAALQYLDFIFSCDVEIENLFSISPEYESERNLFAVKFYCSLYRYKYSACFKQTETLPALMSNGEVSGPSSLIESVRRKTWHRTVLDQNTLPTYEALCFRSQRTTLVLHVAASALIGVQEVVNVTDWAWSISENDIPRPILDTEANMKNVDVLRQSIMQKCACKKTSCDQTRKYCKCVNNKRVCSVLCKCVGCNNTKAVQPANEDPKSALGSSSCTTLSSGSSSSSSNFEDNLPNDAMFLQVPFAFDNEGFVEDDFDI